jgi:hypothetical protein
VTVRRLERTGRPHRLPSDPSLVTFEMERSL